MFSQFYCLMRVKHAFVPWLEPGLVWNRSRGLNYFIGPRTSYSEWVRLNPLPL